MVPKIRSTAAVLKIRVKVIWRKRWARVAAVALAIPTVLLCFFATYYYVRFDGARETTFPRVLARPLELRRGQFMSDTQLVDRLNELGYTRRETALEKPGEFAIGNGLITIKPRGPAFKNQ